MKNRVAFSVSALTLGFGYTVTWAADVPGHGPAIIQVSVCISIPDEDLKAKLPSLDELSARLGRQLKEPGIGLSLTSAACIEKETQPAGDHDELKVLVERKKSQLLFTLQWRPKSGSARCTSPEPFRPYNPEGSLKSTFAEDLVNAVKLNKKLVDYCGKLPGSIEAEGLTVLDAIFREVPLGHGLSTHSSARQPQRIANQPQLIANKVWSDSDERLTIAIQGGPGSRVIANSIGCWKSGSSALLLVEYIACEQKPPDRPWRSTDTTNWDCAPPAEQLKSNTNFFLNPKRQESPRVSTCESVPKS